MKLNPPLVLNDGRIEIVSINESKYEITGIIHFDSTAIHENFESFMTFSGYQMSYAAKYLLDEGFMLWDSENRWHFSLTSIIKNNNI